MKRLIITAVVICVAVLLAVLLITRNNDTTIEKSVTFKLIKTYGAEAEPKEALLSGVYGLEMDSKNNLYFMDRGGRLVSFASDGSFRWQRNKKGNGPGDLQNVRGLAVDGVKYIYLANLNGTRFDKFDLEGKFISSYNLGNSKNTQLTILGFVKPDLLITGKMLRSRSGWELFVLEPDNNYRIRNQFIIDKTGELKMTEGGGGIAFDVGVSNNKIVAGSITDFRLNVYNAEGKEVKEIKKNWNRFYFAFVEGNAAGIVGDISIPYHITGDCYLTFTLYPTNIKEAKDVMKENIKIEFDNIIDIFDEEGNNIFSKQSMGRVSPEIGRPIYSDSEGYLYTFKETPYPQICKYQVIISDKK